MLNSELVFTIVRNHFQKEDCKKRRLSYCHHFNDLFTMFPVTNKSQYNYTKETTIEGIMQTFGVLSDHLLVKYGLSTYDNSSYCVLNFDNSRQINALLLHRI